MIATNYYVKKDIIKWNKFKYSLNKIKKHYLKSDLI